MLLITPLLSWIAVIWVIISFTKMFINKVSVPEKIKEVNYKLSSIELPTDKVKECMNEIASFYGYSDAGFRTLSDSEDDDPDEFVFDPAEGENDWYSEMQINPSLKQYTINTHSPDYGSSNTTLYEYKIDNAELYSRVIESKHEYYTDVDYDIKDNVVLENDVRKSISKSILSSQKDIDDKLARLKSDVEWQKVLPRFKYFIMFRHGDIFKDTELKKYFRSEIERIKSGYAALEQEVTKLGGFIAPIDKDDLLKYMRIRWDNDLSEDKVTLLRELNDNTEKFSISNYELYNLDKIIKELTLYLNKLS